MPKRQVRRKPAEQEPGKPAPLFGDSIHVGVDAGPNRVTFPYDALTRGLAIVGQSGCGKSFLLGRIIEELVVTTPYCRVLLLDSNSDFFFGLAPRDPKEFEADLDKCLGTSDSDLRRAELEAFAEYSDNENETVRRTQVFCDSAELPVLDKELLRIRKFVNVYPLELDWAWPADKLQRYADIIKGGKCSPAYLWLLDVLLDAAEDTRPGPLADLLQSALTTAGEADIGLRVVERADPGSRIPLSKALKLVEAECAVELLDDLRREEERSVWVHRDNDDEARSLADWLFPESRATVLRMDSLGDRRCELAVALCVLEHCFYNHMDMIDRVRWEGVEGGVEASRRALKEGVADRRFAPTFIFIDEAQRYAPEDWSCPQEKLLGELLRRIASEGRKYGLHLILATQRPNKVRKGLLGECSSAVIMKMNSRSDLQYLAEQMRILDVKLLEQCLHFQGVGNAIAVGEITRMPPNAVWFRVAPRRSREGGLDIEKLLTELKSG